MPFCAIGLKLHSRLRFLRIVCSSCIVCLIDTMRQAKRVVKILDRVCRWLRIRSRMDVARVIPFFKGSRVMSAKKSHGSASSDANPPRPVAFFLAVVAAAGISTWYWYRPLPKRASEVSQGPFVAQPSEATAAVGFPKSRSKWKDAGLVFPTETPDLPLSSDSPSPSSPEPNPNPNPTLTGTQDLALQPFQDKSQPLKEWVSNVPLPMVPVQGAESLAAKPLPKPKLWTNAPAPGQPVIESPSTLMAGQPSASKPGDSDAPSPFRVPRVDKPSRSHASNAALARTTEIWPDQGFDPTRPPVSPPVTNLPTQGSLATGANSIPSLSGPTDGSATSSSERIRTLDRELDKSLPQPLQALPSNAPPPTPKSASPRGTVIRQPSPKSPTN